MPKGRGSSSPRGVAHRKTASEGVGAASTFERRTAPVTREAAGPLSARSAIARGMEMRYHGSSEIRGTNCPRSRYYDVGRFGRLFPTLPPLQVDRELLEKIGDAGGLMDPGTDTARNPDNPNPAMSAGFTFLGQFLDHDITFDPTSSLERQVDPEAVSNFRTPAFELDSVYGAGQGASPHLYQRRGREGNNPSKFLIGNDTDGKPNDLPRSPEDVALIGDPRNDENLIVSQLHVGFLKLHNAVVDWLGDHPPAEGRSIFEEAQRLVRWHYQFMIVHDFLPKTVGQKAVDAALAGRRYYRPRHESFIPVEFSVGAYRFGHSQVRPFYGISDGFRGPIFTDPPAPPSDEPTDLSGGRRILAKQVIQWHRFFKFEGAPAAPQPGKRIDTMISPPLLKLPFAAGTPQDPKSLATRNLVRHLTFGLPSGQDVAAAMDVPKDLRLQPEHLKDLRQIGGGLQCQTPLWFYILREAEHFGDDGARLGPVGGTIVAETFIGLLLGDRVSYLRADPRWQPGFGRTMADLLRFAKVAP